MHVGVIGAGLMGTTHVRLLSSEVSGAEVVAVSDAVVASAVRLAGEVGVSTVYADALELIHDPAVEGVVIASPAHTHEAFALACLEAEKPVLCEKPLAVDAAACFVNAQYGYDIRCEVVGATGTAALPLHGADVPSGFQERFAAAYVRELESWASGAPAGASAWDGYAASVVCEAAVESLRTGRPAEIHLTRHAIV